MKNGGETASTFISGKEVSFYITGEVRIMLLQIELTILYNLYIIVGIFEIFLYAVFFIIPLRIYLKKRQISALYFALSYLGWLIVGIFATIYSYDLVYVLGLDLSSRGFWFYLSSFLNYVFLVTSSLFLFLFTTDVFTYKKWNKMLVIIAGIAILVVTLLPINNWFEARLPGEFSYQYITMVLSAVYALTIYTLLALLFIRLTRAKETPPYMKSIYVGAILFDIFLLLTIIGGMNAQIGGYLLLGGWVPMIIGSIYFFRGFIQPTMKAKKLSEGQAV